jgi:hypothetical protein
MDQTTALLLIRRDIGDPSETFLTNTLGDGMTLLFDLPPQNVNPIGLLVQYTQNSVTTVIQPTVVPGTATYDSPTGSSNFAAWSNVPTYQPGALVTYLGNYYQCQISNANTAPNTNSGIWGFPLIVYTLDGVNGMLQFNTPIPNEATIIVTGQAWGMFSDMDLTTILDDATRQHCMGQTITERYRTSEGFITYRDAPKTLANLPALEENLVVTLADIDALWILATDAATDVNIQTAEGTNIDRSARYSQLMTHIQNLRQKYEVWCGQLGVGLFRSEVITIRRVSYTNNRLVPIFREREYDDHRYPVRELPQIDRRDEDTSGIPSPVWNGLPV